MRDLQVDTTFYISNHNDNISREDDYLITTLRSTIKADFSDQLSKEDYLDGVINIKDIGYISSYRINLNYSPDRLILLADLLSSSLCFACSFFFYSEDIILSSENIYLVDEVFIKPEFRGLGFGIKGLAMFLQNFARHETVCCYPDPIFDLSEKYPEKYGKSLMKKYWSKVGLEYYSEGENILWTDSWCIPDWLKHQVFSC